MEADHECEAKDNCVSEILDDVDEAMDDADGPQPVACNDCLQGKSLTVFCNDNCAKSNIASHRMEVHGLKSDDDDTGGLVTSLSEITQKVMEQANPGLTFSSLQ